MRSFALRILANNEAGTWASWPEKIAAIKAFYASVCDLDVTLTPTTLAPQFAPYAPSSGSSNVYRVDEAWYAANVTPLAPGADIVMFVVPPTDHPNIVTLMGLDYFQEGKTGETTVFSDEANHTYVGEADQGETLVNYGCHELSHQFYALLAKTDNTHLYFYAGTPEKVLADFDFDEQELAWYQQAVQDLQQELGLLKARQLPPIGDVAPSEPQDLPTSLQLGQIDNLAAAMNTNGYDVSSNIVFAVGQEPTLGIFGPITSTDLDTICLAIFHSQNIAATTGTQSPINFKTLPQQIGTYFQFSDSSDSPSTNAFIGALKSHVNPIATGFTIFLIDRPSFEQLSAAFAFSLHTANYSALASGLLQWLPVDSAQSDVAPETTQTTPSGPSVSDLATVIKTVIEGWAAPGETLNGTPYPNGTISYQCNNPDNAKYDSQQYATARTFVINGVNEIFADFDTYEHGWQYMIDTLTNICKGTPSVYTDAAIKLGLQNSGDLTLNDFFTVRDPASDANNPGAAAATAAKALNVPVTFQMKQFTV